MCIMARRALFAISLPAELDNNKMKITNDERLVWLYGRRREREREV